MKTQKVTPDTITASIFITPLIKNGELKIAITIFDEMIGAGMVPNDVVVRYGCILRAAICAPRTISTSLRFKSQLRVVCALRSVILH